MNNINHLLDSFKEYKIFGSIPSFIAGAKFDSRSIENGDVFFAMPGQLHDGSDFIANAFENGASVAITQNSAVITKFDKPVILVPSVFDAFVAYAKFRRSLMNNTTVIAVTGSVGKTTTKEALQHFLLRADKTVACAPKNYNNMLGVAYLLANVDLNVEFLIVEIGTNHFGEIQELAKFVEPDYSIITHIGLAHIEYLLNLRSIAKEKGALFEYTKKCAFFNSDFWYADLFEEICKKANVEYSCFQNGEDSTSTLENAWKLLFEKLNVPFYDDPQFAYTIKGRRNIFETDINGKKVVVIDGSYNANLSSMIDGLKFLHTHAENYRGYKKIAILSDMLEVGKKTNRWHKFLGCYVHDAQMLCTGTAIKSAMKNNDIWFSSVDELIQFLQQNIESDCVVFVKGSARKLVPVVEFFSGLKKS